MAQSAEIRETAETVTARKRQKNRKIVKKKEHEGLLKEQDRNTYRMEEDTVHS